jgi:putative protein kinase ArgK-like GTPase of G3E family
VPVVVPTVATSGKGVEALVDGVVAHRMAIAADGTLAARREQRRRHEFQAAVAREVEALAKEIAISDDGRELERQVLAGVLDARSAAAELVRALVPPVDAAGRLGSI